MRLMYVLTHFVIPYCFSLFYSSCYSLATFFRGRDRGELDPVEIKWYMDWLFVRGVNLLYPHAFFYSVDDEKRLNERPPDVGPNNLWWKHFGILSAYAKRMSWLMSDSINITLVAVLCEENFLPWQIVKPLQQNQIEYNYLEENLLCQSSIIADGKISIQKQCYSILLIENPQSLSQKTAKAIKVFLESGGHVIVYNPENKNFNLSGTTEIRNFKDVTGKIHSLIERDVISPHSDLRISHLIKKGIDFFIFVNEGEQTISGESALLNDGALELWDPMTGAISPLNITAQKGKYAYFKMELERRQTLVICINKSVPPLILALEQYKTKSIAIIGKWNFSLPSCQEKQIVTLESWTKFDGMEDYSGEGIYETTFDIENLVPYKKLVLNLGKVCDLAELYINDQSAGVKLWAPYTFDITRFVIDKKFKIRVIVTNSIANRITKIKLNSGLIGPVEIKILN